MNLVDNAPAKINLTLAVTGRRRDGYHLLESLVVFAPDAADSLMLMPGHALALTVAGDTADDAGDVDDNLVLRCARAVLARRPGLKTGAFFLKKMLPVAAGLGGGSADAAAALRLIARVNGVALTDPIFFDAARETGADIAVCLQAQPRVMRGIGDDLSPPLDVFLPHALLVNPRVPCPTPAIFKALGMTPDGATTKNPVPDLELAENWQRYGNDLENTALTHVPVIKAVLDALWQAPGCTFARMSGSGATCFGIFETAEDCAAAENAIRLDHPHWWIMRTALGTGRT